MEPAVTGHYKWGRDHHHGLWDSPRTIWSACRAACFSCLFAPLSRSFLFCRGLTVLQRRLLAKNGSQADLLPIRDKRLPQETDVQGVRVTARCQFFQQ